jgi:HTH domain
MTKRHNRTGRSTGIFRYVALTHWMMRTEAWRSLDCVARCAYLELAMRYAGPGSNNGRLPYSLREMAEALNVSKMTALRAFHRLQECGFIVEMKRGAFRGPRIIATNRQAPPIYPRMIPLCSRFDSVLFTPKMSA